MRSLINSVAGTSAVEFALLVPVFLTIVFGTMGLGAALWAQFGLQHGVEMAARCASINSTVCGNTAAIQSYAVRQTYGINPPATDFAVSTASCGELVTASYDYALLGSSLGLPTVTLTARSCFPK